MMKAVLVVAAALFAAPALADSVPALTGTWKGPSDGIRMKDGFLGGDVTIVISEQKGRSFRGEITYPTDPAGGTPRKEAIIGTIDSDGDRMLIVGDNGHHIAEYDDGVIQDCYIDDGENSIAVCMELKKQ
jgi:hypothetical protein